MQAACSLRQLAATRARKMPRLAGQPLFESLLRFCMQGFMAAAEADSSTPSSLLLTKPQVEAAIQTFSTFLKIVVDGEGG